MLIVYRISADSEETKGYSPATFLVTSDGVYCDSEEIGFFKHPTVTDTAKLLDHICDCKKRGFKTERLVIGG